MSSLKPIITVGLPVYNAAPYLRECIDSILAQTFTDFELLIIDDGSTDESVDIIKSYTDNRIRFIQNEHDYIRTCNMLLNEAKGYYFARMDADDVMMHNRLEIQIGVMESHPEIGILGTQAITNDIYDEKQIAHSKRPLILCLQDFLCTNPIIHPTVIIRKSIIDRLQLRYDPSFCYAEDYYLWCVAIMHNVKLANIAYSSIIYRHHKHQVSSRHYVEMRRKTIKIQKIYSKWVSSIYNPQYHRPPIKESKNDLTIIIPFLNEGDEVYKTLKSIRDSVGNRVDIIVINDQSTDGIDYMSLVKEYDAYYILNKTRKGVAASRDLGVDLCRTPYFLLLDAHMRLYEDNWLDEIVNTLSLNDRQILCAQTKQLWRDEKGMIVELENATVYGAYAKFSSSGMVPDIDWNYHPYSCDERIQEPVACILGAGYAASKRYWQYLKGLRGLEQYGCDEVYISTKAWLEGGRCMLLKGHHFGHIYRNKAPYQNLQASFVYNYLLVAYTLFPISVFLWAKACCQFHQRTQFEAAWSLFRHKQKAIKSLKKEYDSIFTKSAFKVLAMNQYISSCNIKDYNRRILMSDTIFKLIPSKKVENMGVVDGRTALLLWNCLYRRTNKLDIYGEDFYTNFSIIKDAVISRQTPINFRYGMCGVGWAMIYLFSEGIIDCVDEDLLRCIDIAINEVNFEKMTDTSFNTGVGGIISYVINRHAYNLYKGINHYFIPKTISLLKKMARTIIKNSTEISTIFYSELFLRCEDIILTKNYYPSLQHWITTPSYYPENPKYWYYSLDCGCLCYPIPILELRPNIINITI